MKCFFINVISKSNNTGKGILLTKINFITVFNFQEACQSVCVCCNFNGFIMSVSFPDICDCFCNVNKVVRAFWNSYVKPLPLS